MAPNGLKLWRVDHCLRLWNARRFVWVHNRKFSYHPSISRMFSLTSSLLVTWQKRSDGRLQILPFRGNLWRQVQTPCCRLRVAGLGWPWCDKDFGVTGWSWSNSWNSSRWSDLAVVRSILASRSHTVQKRVKRSGSLLRRLQVASKIVAFRSRETPKWGSFQTYENSKYSLTNHKVFKIF